jgi:hypothetical protein
MAASSNGCRGRDGLRLKSEAWAVMGVSHAGRRRWSVYAYWRMREFGELPHFVEQRLNSAAAAAARYCAQFPSPVTNAMASFVAYMAGGFAALAIGVVLTHDYLMERHAWGHTLTWWLAACVMVLAVARGMMEDEAPAYDPVRLQTSCCPAECRFTVLISCRFALRAAHRIVDGHVALRGCVDSRH